MNQTTIDPSSLLERAVKCGDWMVRNQITDRMDANKGRSIRSYDAKTGYKVLTGNWMTGSMAMALLALWKRTGDNRYLEAAEMAGHYIMSLQVMDRDDYYFGAIREITPQSIEFAPRDAVSGAWGLVWLYEATKNPVYLKRAVMFGDWFIEKGMYRGWPLYAIYMDPEMDNFYSRGIFHGGTGLFFHDLFMISGDPRYIEKGLLPIATIYRDQFISDDGRPILERDPFTGKISDAGDKGEVLPMHSINDDFSSAMLIAASRFFEDNSFLYKASLYAHWVFSVQDADGGYEGGKIPSGVPVSEMYLRDIGTLTDDSHLITAAERSLGKMLDMQYLDNSDPCIDGAFNGMYEGKEPDKWGRVCVNMRATAYSLMALLKTESDLEGIWLGTHNKPFRDHRWIGMHDLKF